jgi:hypothetical protein
VIDRICWSEWMKSLKYRIKEKNVDLIENDFQKSEKMGALNFVAFN